MMVPANNDNASKRTKEGPDSRDKVIGARLRVRRNLMKMSQSELGEAVGITFQQIQKYEHGANKISAVRLVDFSQVLKAPINFFYAGLTEINEKTPAPLAVSDIKQEKLEDDMMMNKETLALIRHYYAIKDKKARKQVVNLMKTMADQ